MHYVAALGVALMMMQDDPKIEKGQAAPAFEAKNQKGETVRLGDFKDKKNVLLAFYPKDFTPG